jgi:hypothetical protein
MKQYLSIFLIVLFFLPIFGCNTVSTNTVNGSGNLETQTFNVSNFDSVTLAGFGDVFIKQGSSESLTVKTDDNIIPLLDIRVIGHELVLDTQPQLSINPTHGITYNLTVKALNKIGLKGSGNFSIETVKSKEMKISLLGSGDINFKSLDSDSLSIDLPGSGNISIGNLVVKTIDSNVKGSGDIKLNGKSDMQTISVLGSGNYLAGNLETASSDINIPGSGDLTIWVTDQLKIHVDGSGDVRYYGRPTIDQTGNGSGNVISLGEK